MALSAIPTGPHSLNNMYSYITTALPLEEVVGQTLTPNQALLLERMLYKVDRRIRTTRGGQMLLKLDINEETQALRLYLVRGYAGELDCNRAVSAPDVKLGHWYSVTSSKRY